MFPKMLIQEIQEIKDLLQKDLQYMTKKDFKGHCRKCQEAIVGKSVSFMAKELLYIYHQKCFNCAGCTNQLSQFYTVENKHYCKECYYLKVLGRCDQCQTNFTDATIVKVQEKKFHPQCFICYKCNQQLNDIYIEKNGYLCKSCYEKDFVSICYRCKQGILHEPASLKLRAIEWGTLKFHVDCFNCNICKSTFSDLKALLYEKELLCKSCYDTFSKK
jgi:hypothetical protein